MNNFIRKMIKVLSIIFFFILINHTFNLRYYAGTACCSESSQITTSDGNNASASSLPTPPKYSEGTGFKSQESFLSSREFWLSIIILFFGFIVISAEYALLRNNTATAEEILRIFAVTLIVVGTMFLITASFSNDQIAPAMGLFGTIAGYLLGRKSAHKQE